jgi:chromosome segregation ATPase
MHRAEEECHRLQGLLSTMDASMRTLRSQNAEERERLRGEQARLDIMQSTLKAESDVQRMGVKEEKQRLHEQKMQFDEERLTSGRELTLLRQQIDEERRRLDRERLEHTQLQGETVLQMRRLKEEEAQLRQERIDIDRAFLELDKERYKCEELMAQANDVRKEMDRLDEMKNYMRTVWAQLEDKSEEVKHMLRDTVLAKNKCNEQMNESLRLKNQMKQQKMQVHRGKGKGVGELEQDDSACCLLTRDDLNPLPAVLHDDLFPFACSLTLTRLARNSRKVPWRSAKTPARREEYGLQAESCAEGEKLRGW